MSSKDYHFKIGLFTLLLLLGIIVASFWASDFRFERGDKRYDLYFTHAIRGVGVGSPVYVQGIEAGEVLSIKLAQASDEGTRVKIHIKLEDDIKLYQDAFAQIEWQGITGRKIIEINPGTPSKALLKLSKGQKYKVIATREGALGDFVRESDLLVKELTHLTKQLNLVLSEKNIHEFGELLAVLNRFFNSADHIMPEMRALIDEMRAIAEQLQPMLERADRNPAAFFLGKDDEELVLKK